VDAANLATARTTIQRQIGSRTLSVCEVWACKFATRCLYFASRGNLGTSYLFLPFIEVLSYPAYGSANRCVNPSNAPSILLRACRTRLRLIQDDRFRLSKVNLFVKKFFLFCFFSETPSAVKYGQSETDVTLLISILHVIEFDIIFFAPFDCDFF